jgi:Heavy metal associated domain 2
MDLAIRFPDQGQIHLESRSLFSEPQDPKCQRFLERVFQAPEITQITIKSQQGSTHVPRAELGYCPKTHTLKEVIARVSGLLNASKAHIRRANKSNEASGSNGRVAGTHGPLSLNRHAVVPNVHSKSNAHVVRTNGRSRTNRHSCTRGYERLENARSAGQHSDASRAAVTITSARDSSGEIRYFRYGTIITHWEVKHELPGRLRLKNQIIYRKVELCQALERELMSVLGIAYFKTNPLTSSVLVQYDQQQLSREQIIEILGTALGNAEHISQMNKLDFHLPLCTASVPVAAVAQFAAPALLPAAAILFACTSIPTFRSAKAILLEEKRLGVGVLDAIVVIGCMATMAIFPGAVLCWCLAFGRLSLPPFLSGPMIMFCYFPPVFLRRCW